MGDIAEIAPDVYRITVFIPEFNLEFNHFLVKDDEPLLFHTGLRGTFPEVRDAVARIIDPARLRWIGFSHFESDECGALNQWLAEAPAAEPACNIVSALVSINDFANRPARVFDETETLNTGRHRFRFLRTPHLPHGWDAGVLFEENRRTLFCSDLFHQVGRWEPVTEGDVVERARTTLIEYEGGPFASYCPYTNHTGRMLHRLAELEPATLAVMHGSSFRGACAGALRDLAGVFKEVLGSEQRQVGAG